MDKEIFQKLELRCLINISMMEENHVFSYNKNTKIAGLIFSRNRPIPYSKKITIMEK